MKNKRSVRPFFRVLITCPAQHETYQDYRTLRGAYNCWKDYSDFGGWFAYALIKIDLHTWQKKVLKSVLDK